ncbi:MAG TPA: permease prefix domain 1-containing protein [Pyrinomonadaceae bacterium]|nr:permease prefix domain 1-containing protein [Pyrinomonadaceae bacterium]
MFRVKATVKFIHARQHPDEIAHEVEEELRFHLQKRTQANIEAGMIPAEARIAAQQSFGDFNRIKMSCCEIKRSLPFNMKALTMGLFIAIACLAGGVALVAVNLPHHNLLGVIWQLAAIAVLLCSFLVGRRKNR